MKHSWYNKKYRKSSNKCVKLYAEFWRKVEEYLFNNHNDQNDEGSKIVS